MKLAQLSPWGKAIQLPLERYVAVLGNCWCGCHGYSIMPQRSRWSWRRKQVFEIIVVVRNQALDQTISGLQLFTIDYQYIVEFRKQTPDQIVGTSWSHMGIKPHTKQDQELNHTLLLVRGYLPLHHDCWGQWWLVDFLIDIQNTDECAHGWRQLTRRLVMVADQTPKQKLLATFTK